MPIVARKYFSGPFWLHAAKIKTLVLPFYADRAVPSLHSQITITCTDILFVRCHFKNNSNNYPK
jgi:hypothetical protein